MHLILFHSDSNTVLNNKTTSFIGFTAVFAQAFSWLDENSKIPTHGKYNMYKKWIFPVTEEEQ